MKVPSGDDRVFTARAYEYNTLRMSGSSTLSKVIEGAQQSVIINLDDLAGISILPPAVTLQTDDTQQFTASVTHHQDTSVSWSVNGMPGGNSTVGTIDAAGLYTAPNSVPTPSTVTVSAISNADGNLTANATVTIIPAPTPIIVTVLPQNPTIAPLQVQQFTASVTGTPNSSVTWTVQDIDCSAEQGSIDSGGLYTAGNPAGQCSVTIRATSVADPTVSGASTLTIRPTCPLPVLNVTSTNDAVDANIGDGVCDDGTGNCTLRAAIQEANDCPGPDTINVPAGTYLLTIAGTGEQAAATGDLDITDELTINGAGSATTIIDANALDRAFHIRNGVSTINAIAVVNGLGNESWGGGGIRVDTGSTLNLNQARVANNQSPGSGGAADGGGISNGGTLNIDSSDISSNTTLWGGAGIYNGGTLTVTNSTIDGNSCTGTGNAACAGSGINSSSTATASVTVTGTTISNNSAFNGGGIYIVGSVMTIDSSIISNNSATNGGGGIWQGGYGLSSQLIITNSSISSNTVLSGGNGFGGGLHVEPSSSVSISNSTFDGNIASSSGGGINTFSPITVTDSTFINNQAGYGGGIDSGAVLVVTGSTFSGNSASFDGGGIKAGANKQITNSTFSGNTANQGGGIYASGSTLPADNAITNTTITGNTATTGGGIVNGGVPWWGGWTSLVNTIVANNTGGDCHNGTYGNFAVTSSLDSDGSCNNAVTADPLLGPLADNGGPTQTHALQAGSPAIDAGDDSACPLTDQRGIGRPQGGHCDIGAYEY
jgi:CSLREA domain-containing protein